MRARPAEYHGPPRGGDWLADELAALRRRGVDVVVHCRYGIGRASLLAGALLVREGCDPQQAWAELSCVRGYAVPDTDQQRTWLADLKAQPPESS